MTIRFYRCDGPTGTPRAAGIDEVSIRIWQPARDGPPDRGSRRPANLCWWVLARLGFFARNDFAELSIWHDERMLHRLVVTPRWYRFPFMGERDLQLGDLWTHPEVRGRGLAGVAVAEAVRRFGMDGERFWYVVDAGNTASIRLIESCGFRLVGTGRRTCPFGLRPFGRFRLEISHP